MPAWRAWTVAHTQRFLKVDLSVSDISEALSTARSLHLAIVGAGAPLRQQESACCTEYEVRPIYDRLACVRKS